MDLLGADYFFRASKTAKAEDIAGCFFDLAMYFQDKNKSAVDIFFDRNSTHKNKMRDIFAELSKNLRIDVQFHFISAYSPKLNLVEYVIHWIRQKVLHNADHKKSLPEFQAAVENLCKNGEILSKEQIFNILCHIESLVLKV